MSVKLDKEPFLIGCQWVTTPEIGENQYLEWGHLGSALNLPDEILAIINLYLKHVYRIQWAQTCRFFRYRLFNYVRYMSMTGCPENLYEKILSRYHYIRFLRFKITSGGCLPSPNVLRHIKNISKLVINFQYPITQYENTIQSLHLLEDWILSQPLHTLHLNLDMISSCSRQRILRKGTLRKLLYPIPLRMVHEVPTEIDDLTILIPSYPKDIIQIRRFNKLTALGLMFVTETISENLRELYSWMSKIPEVRFYCANIKLQNSSYQDIIEGPCTIITCKINKPKFLTDLIIYHCNNKTRLRQVYIEGIDQVSLSNVLDRMSTSLLSSIPFKIGYKELPLLTVQDLCILLHEQLKSK